MIGVVFGMAAAAQIDRNDVPLGGPAASAGASSSKSAAVRARPGRQTTGNPGRGARAVFAHVQPQPVLRRDEKALAVIVRAVTRVRHQMRGGLVHRLSQSSA